MKGSRKELILELQQLVDQCGNKLAKYSEASEKIWNFKENPEKWSALECLEHLNRYGNFYLPEIQRRIASAPDSLVDVYATGVLGSYFTKSMKVVDQKVKPMKTFANMNPINSNLSMNVITVFKTQLDEFSRLLEAASTKNLTKTKTNISISKILKMRLCDTLQFYLYHVERHLFQAEKALLLASQNK